MLIIHLLLRHHSYVESDDSGWGVFSTDLVLAYQIRRADLEKGVCCCFC